MRVAQLMTVLLLACLASTAIGRTYTKSDCPAYSYPPATFNSHGLLGIEGEFSSLDTYFLDLNTSNTEITLSLTKESAARFHVRCNVGGVELTLVKGTPETVVLKSNAVSAGETRIAGILATGDYKLKIKPVGLIDASGLKTCPTLVVSASVVPKDKISARAAQLQCGTDPLPTPNMFDAAAYTAPVSYSFDTGSQQFVVKRRSGFNIIKTYPFELKLANSPVMFRVRALIESDFMLGGDVGMVVVRGNKASLDPADCGTKENCVFVNRLSQSEAGINIGLAAGKYTLMLYQDGREYADNVPFLANWPCTYYGTRITIDSDGGAATPEVCTAFPPPATFNSPGLLNADGYLHFRQDLLLNLAQSSHIIEFTITKKSFFRVYASEHKVDIDLALYESGNPDAKAYSMAMAGEEGIALTLAPGDYQLKMFYFGFQDVTLDACDTYSLQVDIAPTTVAALIQCPVDEVKPDLSGMADALRQLDYYYLQPETDYSHKLSATLVDQEQILKQTFTLSKDSSIQVVTFSDFVLGDVVSWLESSNGKIRSTHLMDRNVLHADIRAGEYTLYVAMGKIQKPTVDVTDLPSCAKYRLSVEIAVRDSERVPHIACKNAVYLPKTLDAIGWRQYNEGVHFAAQILVPSTSVFRSEQETKFTVTSQSVARFFVDTHHLDIDMMLYQDDDVWPVDFAVKVNQADSILYVAEPGHTYRLVIVSYHNDFSVDEHSCLSFVLEGSIMPVTRKPITPCTQDTPNKLPPVDLLQHANADGDVRVKNFDYFFTQTAVPRRMEYVFEVTNMYTIVKGYVQSDFAFGHLIAHVERVTSAREDSVTKNIREVLEDSWTVEKAVAAAARSDQDTSSYLGVNGYNTALVEPMMLMPGTYKLVINETREMPSSVRGCVSFGMDIAIVQMRHSDYDSASCDAHTFPASLNTPGFLGTPMSESQVHLTRDVQVHVANKIFKEQLSTFKVSEDSVFKMLMPSHPTVDIDAVLYRGTPSSLGQIVDSLFGTGSEGMSTVLSPGDYTLRFTYHAVRYDQAVDATCLHYEIQLQLVKMSALKALPDLANACTVTRPARVLAVDNKPHHETYHWSVDDSSVVLDLALTEQTLVQFDVQSHFAANALGCVLEGSTPSPIDNTPISVRLDCEMAPNSLFLSRQLPPGRYTIRIARPISGSHDKLPIDTFKCWPYQLVYYLTTTDVTPDPCPSFVILPTDLYSMNGGSLGYGGPQEVDGTIRLYMKEVPIPRRIQIFDTQVVKVMAPKDMLLRVYIRSVAGLDIDVLVYRGPNHTSDNFIGMSLDMGEDESVLLTLPKSSVPYDIVLMYWKVPEYSISGKCPSFMFEVALKPKTTVVSQLTCPAEMPINPLPPKNVDNIAPADHSVIVFGDYILASDTQAIYQDAGWFTYDIAINGGTNSTVFAYVAYDFLANDFRLKLYNTDAQGKKKSQIANSWLDPNPERDKPWKNFGQALVTSSLPAGKYILSIQQDLSDVNAFKDLPRYCSLFYFYLQSTSNTEKYEPSVMSVSPASGADLDYTQDLLLRVTFSEAVYDSYKLSDEMLKTPIAFLTSYMSKVVLPEAAAFWDSGRTLLVLFNYRYFEAGTTYEFHMDMARFHPKSNPAIQFLGGFDKHWYSMTTCKCMGHGHCRNVTIGDLTCICDTPYDGKYCDACLSGFHMVGDQCFENVRCKPNSCNGHGTCEDSTGVPVCACDLGWTTSGDVKCGVCASGFHKDTQGNCMKDTDGDGRTPRCKAPLLPATLDVIGLLKYRNAIHLRGDYYIDVSLGYHYTTFTIDRDMLMRLYLSPSWIDVDVFVLRFVTDTETEIVASATHFQEKDESLLLELKHSTLNKYQLRFMYYNWDQSRTPNCETFSLELAMAPYVTGYETLSAQWCPTSNKLPAIPSPSPTDKTPYPPVPGTGFVFDKPESYAILGTTSEVTASDYFYSWSFSVLELPDQHAVIDAQLGYRFLTGDVEIMLEAGNTKDHCAHAGKCVYGFDLHNQNVLRRKIAPGNYTLWLYQAIPLKTKYSKCAEFDFKLNIRYEKVEENIFNCEAQRVPDNLAIEEYMGNGDGSVSGRIHLFEKFYLDITKKLHLIYFDIKEKSMFRALVPAHEVDIDLLLYNRRDMTHPIVASMSYYDDDVIYEALPVGGYALEIRYYFSPQQYTLDACATFDMELAIQPVSASSLVDVTCPANHASVLPNWCSILGTCPPTNTPQISTKTSFGVPTVKSPYPKTFYFYNLVGQERETVDTVVTSLAFELKVPALLWSKLQYDFLTSDMDLVLTMQQTRDAPEQPEIDQGILAAKQSLLGPETKVRDLTKTRATKTVAGSHDYNIDYLFQVLYPGMYNLTIVQVLPPAVGDTLECAPFTFEFDLAPTANIADLDKILTCGKQTTRLPHTLNTPDALGRDGHSHVWSDTWLVPDNWAYLHQEHTIKFSVRTPSLFRAYVGPSILDIDIMLYNQGSDRSINSLVQASQSYFKDESIFVLVLPGFNYELDVVFYKWDIDVPACLGFSMELGIEPLAAHGLPQNCPSGQSSWPTGPQIPLPTSNPWVYDSVDKADVLYAQPAISVTSSHQIPIRLVQPADLHAEIGYHFPYSGFGLVLESAEHTQTWYGLNGRNRHVLNVRGLTAGNYTLKMYESHTPVKDSLHCMYYTFYLAVAQASQGGIASDTHVPALPTTLNSVAYLWRDPSAAGLVTLPMVPKDLAVDSANCMHLEGSYLINAVDRKDSVFFSVTSPVVFRAYTSPHRVDIDMHLYVKDGPNSYKEVAKSASLDGEEVLYKDLAIGSYRLDFKYYASSAHDWYFPSPAAHEAFELELAISAQSILSHTTARYPKTCTTDTMLDAITPDAAGFYKSVYREACVTEASAKAKAGLTKPVASTGAFELKTESIVNVVVRSDFLLGDIMLVVKPVTATRENVLEASGFVNQYDAMELNVVLQPGKYDLLLYQPQALLAILKVPVLYNLEIDVFPTSHKGNHLCPFDTSYLPTDLNSATGGSKPYGGPMTADGFAYIYGDHFLTQHAQSLAFSTQVPVVSRIFYQTSNPMLDVRSDVYRVANISNNKVKFLVAPLLSSTTETQTSKVFLFPEPNSVTLPMHLECSFTYAQPWEDPCWDFTYAFHSEAVSSVVSKVLCPFNITNMWVVPNKTPKIDADGFGYEYVSSYTPRDALPADEPWMYDVRVPLNRKSELYVAYGYNGLANEYSILLLQEVKDSAGKTSLVVRTRSVTSLEQTTGGSVGEISVRQTIAGTLDAGVYVLRISSSLHSRNLLPLADEKRQLCFPFVYELRVSPSDVSMPFVRDVNPPGRENLSPLQPLVITVSFSETVYDFYGSVITGDHDERIAKAFSLTDGKTEIAPSSVTKASTSGLRWVLTFSADSLYKGITKPVSWTLRLLASRLFDSDRNVVQMTNIYSYKTLDTTCDGRGGFMPIHGGVCVCNEGYAHVDCDVCAVGYYPRYGQEDAHDPSLLCVKYGSEVCAKNTCGDAEGRGKCNDKTGILQCVCSAGFDGDRCQRCASNYYGYPHCKAKQKCVYDCHTGQCDFTTGQCVCPPGLEAPDCLTKTSDKTEEATPLMKTVRVAGVSVAIAVMAGAIVVFVRQERKRRRGPQGRGRYRRIALNAEVPVEDEEEEVPDEEAAAQDAQGDFETQDNEEQEAPAAPEPSTRARPTLVPQPKKKTKTPPPPEETKTKQQAQPLPDEDESSSDDEARLFRPKSFVRK